MANFNTHLAVASVGSGLCATVALAGHAAPNNYLLTLTLAGAIGGIIRISILRERFRRACFSACSASWPHSSLCSHYEQHSIAELWLVWLGAYFVAIRGL